MLVTGWGTAQKVTVSNNYFDGTTDYGHYCNGKHYWVMLLLGENQSLTVIGNRIHNTSGRSPEVGRPASATTVGTVHIVNNYYDQNYYMGIGPTDDVLTPIEGNYFALGDYFFPIFSSSATNEIFAPVASNQAAANTACQAALGRDCVINYDANSSTNFILNSSVMPAIGANTAVKAGVSSVVPAAYSTVPSHVAGPQASLD
jgi:pectate lyase